MISSHEAAGLLYQTTHCPTWHPFSIPPYSSSCCGNRLQAGVTSRLLASAVPLVISYLSSGTSLLPHGTAVGPRQPAQTWECKGVHNSRATPSLFESLWGLRLGCPGWWSTSYHTLTLAFLPSLSFSSSLGPLPAQALVSHAGLLGET